MSGGDDVLGKALDRTLLRRIFVYVWPYKLWLALAVVLLPIASVFEIAQPYLLKRAIDDHIARGRLAGLDRLGVLYLLALVGQYGASFQSMPKIATRIAPRRITSPTRLTSPEANISFSASTSLVMRVMRRPIGVRSKNDEASASTWRCKRRRRSFIARCPTSWVR